MIDESVCVVEAFLCQSSLSFLYTAVPNHMIRYRGCAQCVLLMMAH